MAGKMGSFNDGENGISGGGGSEFLGGRGGRLLFCMSWADLGIGIGGLLWDLGDR